MRYLHFAALLALGLPLAAAAGSFQSPLDQPAAMSQLAARSPLLAAASAGKRLVAVGQRGHIVYSDDGGANWKQASVPVSTNLVALAFPSEKKGWAVGHGGVVLHTADGGTTWVRQLDGRRSAELAIRHLEAQAAGNPEGEKLVAREKRLLADGGTQPLMAVYFENESSGWVVGTFNRIFRTEDGGKTWTPWMGRTDNPNELHFYSVAGDAKGIYLAGEQGMVWRLDADKQRFVARPLPYQGSVFGLLTDGAGTLLAFGLRGSLFRSVDDGKSWERVAIGTPAGITSGVVEPGGDILLVTQSGEIFRSADRGRSFASVRAAKPMAYYGISALPQGGMVLVGSDGVRLETARK